MENLTILIYQNVQIVLFHLVNFSVHLFVLSCTFTFQSCVTSFSLNAIYNYFINLFDLIIDNIEFIPLTRFLLFEICIEI